MATLFVWKANGATVCRFHCTPSDWDYEPLSAMETREFSACSRPRASPACRLVSPARWAMGANGRERHLALVCKPSSTARRCAYESRQVSPEPG